MSDSLRTPINALEYFALLVAQEDSLPLAETAAYIAQIEYELLSFSEVADALDQLVQQAQLKIAADSSALQKIWLLNQFLYKDLGFEGHNVTSSNVALSCINWVLKTHRGTDVLLAIIYLEVASALGLKARGIAFPEHFLIKIRLSRPQGAPAEVIIDPMNGKSLNMEDIQVLLTPYKKEHGLVDEFDIPSDLFLETASKKDMVGNVLSTLRASYTQQEEWALLVKVLDRLIMLYPEHIENYRERGFALIKQGLPEQAAIDLEYYLKQAKQQLVSDADIVKQQLTTLRNLH